MTMDGGDTKTEFTLEISVFKDKDYLLPYGIRDFPLKVSLGNPLFVQVGQQARTVEYFKYRSLFQFLLLLIVCWCVRTMFSSSSVS